MRGIHENTVIQIDITNACHLGCANCTRFVGHHRKPYFMDDKTFIQAIGSLDGYPGRIGIMGGEPALHPRFTVLLAKFREMVPDKDKREMWTSGWQWAEYKEDILDTFHKERVAFNDHSQPSGRPQPLLVAIDEVVKDDDLRRTLIDNCPFQARWSASITPKGAFFCEIAAAQDWLLDGPGGYPLVKDWWRKEPDAFQDQVETYCGKCSGALPMPTYSDGRGGRDGPTRDVVSPGNLERLLRAGPPKCQRDDVEVWRSHITEEGIDPDWNPRAFRNFVAHDPKDVEEALGTIVDTTT